MALPAAAWGMRRAFAASGDCGGVLCVQIHPENRISFLDCEGNFVLRK